MPDLAALLLAAAFLSMAMTLAFIVQNRTGQSGWIDTIWSFSTGIAAMGLILSAPGDSSSGGRRLLVLGLIAVWALRLGSHIARRTKGAGDDPRYAAMKLEWGVSAQRRLFLFLQIQALCALPLALAVALAANRIGPFPTVQDVLGFGVIALGLWGAARADSQLTAFRRAGGGPVCDVGLWAHSRHPNYFFEWLGWCGWPIIALHPGGSDGYGYLALLAPLMMYWLLVHASGIPPLEAHMVRSRGEAYRDYQRRVPAFFPAVSGGGPR